MLFGINEKIFHREKVMRKSLTIVVVTILGVVLSLSFVSCNPDTSNNGGVGSESTGSGSDFGSFNDDPASVETRQEILNAKIPPIPDTHYDSGVFFTNGYFLDDDPNYQKASNYYLVLNNGAFSLYIFVSEDEEVTEEENYDYIHNDYDYATETSTKKYYKCVDSRFDRIDGTYEISSDGFKSSDGFNDYDRMRLYRDGEADPFIDDKFFYFGSDVHLSGDYFVKFCDGTTVELANKDSIVGTWAVDKGGNMKEYLVFSKDGWLQKYTVMDESFSVENLRYEVSNGLLTIENTKTEEKHPLVIVDGKYLFKDIGYDKYHDSYVKISNSALPLKNPKTNPLSNKNPSYTAPVVTSKIEGTYCDIECKEDYDYVDFLPNGKALLVGEEGFDEGTYTKDSDGIFFVKIGEKDCRIGSIDLEHKISDEHISKANNINEILGSWFFKGEDSDGKVTQELKISNDSLDGCEVRATSYQIAKFPQYSFSDSILFITSSIYGTRSLPIFMCGEYLVFGEIAFSR